LLRSRVDTQTDTVKELGFDLVTTDPDEFFSQPLDLVDVCSPNHLHAAQARRALDAGMAVYCEKPLAANLEDARALASLAEKQHAITQVAYAMRFTPAVRQIKAMCQSGDLGEVLHFRGYMHHSGYLDETRPMSWRLRRSESGGGAMMDLGAHLVDLTRYLLGEVATVRAEMRTFVCQRCTSAGGAAMERVDVDDFALVTLELLNGAVGVLEVTRVAAGASEATGFEIYGRKGSAHFQTAQPEQARFYLSGKKQWVSGYPNMPAVAGERPIESLWPSSKFSQGYFTNHHMAEAMDVLLNVAERRQSLVDFCSAARDQEVVEAAYHSAADGGRRVLITH
jgi:predicted dehydrogenase